MQKKAHFHLTTFQVIAGGFIVLIFVGAGLLALPISSREPGSAPFLDCLFTATSAVCVTGLIVRDTATFWSPFGQAVLLILIQIGGMGVVTTAAAIAFLSGRRIGLKQRSTMQEALSAPQVGGIVRLTRFILFSSFLIEAAGALLLYPVFFHEVGPWKGIWYAVFHSISAFCNAGFDLMGIKAPFSSMTSLAQNPLLNLALILLITVGGIGFLTWNDIKTNRFQFKKYRMQSKVILITSLALFLLPALYFYLFEMEEYSAVQRLLPSLFQSATLRTAGFNTVDLAALSGSAQAFMIVFMLIGGSPGSTAGGLKTTTVAVLLLSSRAVFRRREHVECFGRRIADDTVRHAVAILLMYLGLFFISGMIISRVERLPLLTCLFETASAVGTVGVTLGITTKLGAVSRWILMVLMLFGRVGGLTLIYAAQSGLKAPHGVLPLEKITVG